MRTGIYVYKPTKLTIKATEPVVLTSLDNRSISFENTGLQSTDVPAGIYKAVTREAISVIGVALDGAGLAGNVIDVVVVPDDKDPFPDAPAEATTTFNLSSTTIKSFFKIVGLKSAAF